MGGRADPAVGNEALAGTRRSDFFFAGTRRSLVPHTKTKTIFSTLKPRLVEHTHGRIFWGRCTDVPDVPLVGIRNSLRSKNIYYIKQKKTIQIFYVYFAITQKRVVGQGEGSKFIYLVRINCS